MIFCPARSCFGGSLNEIVHSNWAPINTETAKRIGVKTGDLIRVESPVGHLVTKAYVTEGQHPKVIAISTACGHWGYGRLAQLKLKDKAEPVPMPPPAWPDAPVATVGFATTAADPPDPVGTFPPLHLLNCVFLD